MSSVRDTNGAQVAAERPAGRMIALIGADGTGKSTISRYLSEALGVRARTIYMGSNPSAATHVLPTTRLLWAMKRALDKELHHSGPPDANHFRTRPRTARRRLYHHVKSLARLVPLVTDELYRFGFAAWHLRRGRTVIVDRHPLPDHFGRDRRGTRGWLRAGDRIHGWLIEHVYPRPDRIVHLDAPVEVLWARKPEGSREALEARRSEYREFAADDRTVVTVDATAPIEDVVAIVQELALARVASLAASAPPRTTLARRLRQLRTRTYYRTLDAIVAASTRSGTNPRVPVSPTSNFERIGRWTRAAERTAPRVVRALVGRLERLDRLPFRPAGLYALAYGTGSTCYALETKPRCAVKVIRISLGHDVPMLLELGSKLQRDHALLATWYSDVPGLLAPTVILVLHGPLRGATAVARVQPFIEGRTSDLLADHTDEDLLERLAAHAGLRASFVAFARSTKRCFDGGTYILDMLGHENLMLVEDEAGPRLHVIDLGVTDLVEQRIERPAVYARIEAVVARLERLAAACGDPSEATQ